MKSSLRSILLTAAASLLAAGAGISLYAQDTAKEDIKEAGRSTKRAVKKTGSATKKTAKKAANATAKEVDKGAKKVKEKTQ